VSCCTAAKGQPDCGWRVTSLQMTFDKQSNGRRIVVVTTAYNQPLVSTQPGHPSVARRNAPRVISWDLVVHLRLRRKTSIGPIKKRKKKKKEGEEEEEDEEEEEGEGEGGEEEEDEEAEGEGEGEEEAEGEGEGEEVEVEEVEVEEEKKKKKKDWEGKKFLLSV